VSAAPVFNFPNCFVCGSENPQGLHIDFHADGPDGCRAQYTARPEHTGWPGIVHGGLLFTLMDEALAWALAYSGLRGVTARGDVRFCSPARVGTPLVITARLVARRRDLVRARAEIRTANGNQDLIAELEASMYLTDVEQWQLFVGTDL
jgi:acyl-coenzyme A thioesterase PaaI-like protein